jgi:hypothetical protein
MASQPWTGKQPSNVEIGRSQETEANVRRQLAARSFYRVGKQVHFGGISLTLVLALVSPLVLLFLPSWGPTLGAVAGAWIFIARFVFGPLEQRQHLKGARAQEAFDCDVLGLPWNDSLVQHVSDEEIRRASGDMKGEASIRDWYPVDSPASWPASVLICQRANAVWARRQHAIYRWVLIGSATAWWIVGIVVAVLHGASLAEYLTTILLPSLPALLDAAELSRAHADAAVTRHELEGQCDSLLRQGTAVEQDLREIQDQLFGLRADGTVIPERFYKLIRSRFEEDMKYAASQQQGDSRSTEQESV